MNEVLVLDSQCEDDTDRIGSVLAHAIGTGLVIGLNGQLGAGKTRFVRSLCCALQVDSQFVSSPTFVLMQLYTDGRIPVAHFDTYRVGDVDEFLAIGAEDYLFSDEWLSLIEWAERVSEVLPADRLTVDIQPTSETARRLVFSAGGLKSTGVLDRMQQRLR